MTNEYETFLDKCDVIANHGTAIGEPLHQTALDLVQLLRMVRETADSALPYAVAAARADGASWEKVARMLDVTMGKAMGRSLAKVVSMDVREAILTELARCYREDHKAAGWVGFAELFPDDMATVKAMASAMPLRIASGM